MNNPKRGKLIIIEGGDGSGKGTQSELLIKKLRESGQKVQYLDFPQYDKTFGALCGRALKGEFGDFKKLSPYLASLPYMLDRLTAKDKITEALKHGWVICNRYTPSNVAFQAAKLTGAKRKEFINFLENAEYKVLGLPEPDLVIYLYVPVAIASKLVAMKQKRHYLKGAKKDQHEKDVSYQKKAADMYTSLAKNRSNWKIINCIKKGKLASVEEISGMIDKVLNLK